MTDRMAAMRRRVAAAGAHERTGRRLDYGDAESFRREAAAFRKSPCATCGKTR